MNNIDNASKSLKKIIKNKVSAVNCNENSPAQQLGGKKRKQADNNDDISMPRKPKKKKLNDDQDIISNSLSNQEATSSEVIKKSKTRSGLNRVLNSNNTDTNLALIEDKTEFLTNENLKTRKGKKKAKAVEELSNIEELNLQLNDSQNTNTPIVFEQEMVVKKRKKKIKIGEEPLEVDSNLQEKSNFQVTDLQPIFEQTDSPTMPEEEIPVKKRKKKKFNEEPFGMETSVQDKSNFWLDEPQLATDHINSYTEQKMEIKNEPFGINANSEEFDVQDNDLKPMYEHTSTPTISGEVIPVKKQKKKVKAEPLEMDLNSQEESNLQVNNLISSSLQPESEYTNSTLVLEQEVSLKKHKKKNNSSQINPKEGIGVHDSEHNNINNELISTASKRGRRKSKVVKDMSGEAINKNVGNNVANEGLALVNMSADLTALALEGLKNPLNNNDAEIKQEVNIIDIKSEVGGNNNENVVTISIRDVAISSKADENNMLLKQLEKKMKPSKSSKGIKETFDWPPSDLNELLTRMQVCIPQNDCLPFIKRLDKLQWDAVAFKNYSVEQCKNTWQKLQKRVRKFRLLNEIVQDVKHWVTTVHAKGKRKVGRPPKHPDMPRKPLTAYFIYYLEQRDAYHSLHPGVDAAEMSKILAQHFQNMSPEEKKKYHDLALENRAKYNKKLEEFYKTHPEIPQISPRTKPEKLPRPPKIVKEKAPPKPPKEKVPLKPHPPFHYFYMSELEKDNSEDKVKFKEICKEKWKQLPERTRLVWIHYAEAEIAKYEEEIDEYAKAHPEFVKTPLRPILSREDIQIKNRAAGKPDKPPGSAYNLFASKFLHSDDIKNVPVKDRLVFVSNQWKYCTEEEKKHYKDLYDDVVKKYKQDFAAYLESLPEEERKLELAKVVPKKVKEVVNISKRKKLTKKKASARKTVRAVKPKPESTAKSKPEIRTERLKEPEQPPISPLKYFATVYTGEEPVAQAWKALTREQRKVYEEELMTKKRAYIQDFEKFLKSLTAEELEAFTKERRRIKQEQAEEDDDRNSDDSDSDDSDEQDSSSEDDVDN